jgi:hypothetical protein
LPANKNTRPGPSISGAALHRQRRDTKQIQQLPLVLVDAFDLAVEDPLPVDARPALGEQPGREAFLGAPLRREQALAQMSMIGVAVQLSERVGIGEPARADRLAQQGSQFGIGKRQPAPLRDPVGHVGEALGQYVGDLPQRRRAEQVAVQLGHAIGRVRADAREVCHAHPWGFSRVDDGRPIEPRRVGREAAADAIAPAAVELLHDLEVAR